MLVEYLYLCFSLYLADSITKWRIETIFRDM